MTTLEKQTFLKEMGFDPGELDGLPGPKTSAAWQAYEDSLPHVQNADTQYSINNGKVNELEYMEAKGFGGEMDQPTLLCMHFTCGSPYSCATYFRDDPENRQVSAHFVVQPDGTIIQCVPTNRVAWHTGHAVYKGHSVNGSCNAFSIGIEMENFGNLDEKNGKFYAYDHLIPPERVIKAAHRNEPGVIRPWETYTGEQIVAATELAKAICTFYNIKDITGHDVISPANKNDPGPAWDMDTFVKNVLG